VCPHTDAKEWFSASYAALGRHLWHAKCCRTSRLGGMTIAYLQDLLRRHVGFRGPVQVKTIISEAKMTAANSHKTWGRGGMQ
jgi:hypothetical protein